MSKVKILIISGDGLNCENETASAFKEAGGNCNIVHINDFIKNPGLLLENHILAIPGGFSFGDEINSGKILGLKIKYYLERELQTFIDNKGLIIGICNGFQTLVKLGLLPTPNAKKVLTLAHNNQEKFIDKWVEISNDNKSVCLWTKNLPKEFFLPIRHGEGKIQIRGNDEDHSQIYGELLENGQIPLTYSNDVNGSYKKIAGLCDPTGRIFALMPHPEAATNNLLRPFDKKNETGIGHYFFKNAIDYVNKNILETD